MNSNNPEFVISRTFNAPRELVWKVWTIPEQMAEWWGPKGFSIGKYSMNFRLGGTYHYSMRAPDGSMMWGKFLYQEIIAPQKMVFINMFSDAEGGVTRHPFSPSWPLQLLSTVTFEETGNRTKVTIHWAPLNAAPEEIKTFAGSIAGMEQGWGGTLDQLEVYLAKGAGAA